MKQALKNTLPTRLVEWLANTYDAIRRLPDQPAAYLHPWRRESIRKLAALYDAHKGERCFVVGNGPSLKSMDLSKLQGEFSFGFNRIFLAAAELGFTPSCIVSINDLVIEQSVAELQALKMPKFFAWHARKWLSMDADTHFIYTSYTGPGFSKDVTGRVWEGATVTNVALQLAYHMGFSKVILIGVDHNFASQGTPNTMVTSTGDDPNHFSGAYFGKGFRWQLPDLETSERGYRNARQAFEADGRQVVDATVGGKLTIFPRVDYNTLF
ncbi:MAG TPA: 6-hydroxymethylpterin diphosphokinase MptE-like protein [Bellilinea sp.]|nr:6-hydroxymethylpterin diphosphokinase MptE-like protein [Bellilinea sp.]